jgi:hypothetical protein
MPCSTASSSPCCTLISKCTVFPDKKSTHGDLKLSVSDLPMLSVHYIQKGGLFARPPIPIESLVTLLKSGLSQTLSHFPPLAGRFRTDCDGYVYITCNDDGVDFIHATATNLFIRDILAPTHVPDFVKDFFAFDRTVSYNGHFKPILAVQVTELADGIFIGCAVNHAVTDGTSFWNFFNTFAEVSRGVKRISKQPDFTRSSLLISPAVLRLPEGGPTVTFSVNEPLSERIFSFSREAILKLKDRTNNRKWSDNGHVDAVELMGKQSNDAYLNNNTNGKVTAILENWFKNAVSKSVNDEMEGLAEAPPARQLPLSPLLLVTATRLLLLLMSSRTMTCVRRMKDGSTDNATANHRGLFLLLRGGEEHPVGKETNNSAPAAGRDE